MSDDAEKHFDLTSAAGTKEAYSWASQAGQAAAVAASVAFANAAGIGLLAAGGGALLGPLGVLVYPAYKLIKRSLSTSKASKEQAEAAVEIIKAGREAGVKRMTVEVDNQAGLDIGSDIEGIPVRCMVGSKGRVRLEVEYA